MKETQIRTAMPVGYVGACMVRDVSPDYLYLRRTGDTRIPTYRAAVAVGPAEVGDISPACSTWNRSDSEEKLASMKRVVDNSFPACDFTPGV
jgi:hypothetical protein